MRYVAKFNNGAWKVFDTEAYTDVAILGLQKAAEEAAIQFNLGAATSKAR